MEVKNNNTQTVYFLFYWWSKYFHQQTNDNVPARILFLSLNFLLSIDPVMEPNLQVIICQDAPQVCQVNIVFFFSAAVQFRSLLSSVVVIMCHPSQAASSEVQE